MSKAIVVRRIEEDVSLSEAEKSAEIEAGNRIELLGVVSCHSKKPSRKSKVRVLPCGRGKSFHANIHSQVWKDYNEGKITFKQLKASLTVQEGKPLPTREQPQWMKDLLAKHRKESPTTDRPSEPRPVLKF
jgi:hypothetical protein